MTEKEELLERLNKYKWVVGDCWRWTGTITSTGRPSIHFNGRMVLVYRLIMWIVHDFDINSKLYVLHKTKDGTCKYKDCWQSDHLYVGTNSDNMRDRVFTHCKNGHEYNEENTFYSQGTLRCRECKRRKDKEWSKKKKLKQVHQTG